MAIYRKAKKCLSRKWMPKQNKYALKPDTTNLVICPSRYPPLPSSFLRCRFFWWNKLLRKRFSIVKPSLFNWLVLMNITLACSYQWVPSKSSFASSNTIRYLEIIFREWTWKFQAKVYRWNSMKFSALFPLPLSPNWGNVGGPKSWRIR